jgi:hypothetical protein
VGNGTGYTIKMEGSKETQTFSIVNAEGAVSFPCTVAGTGGCPSGGVGWGG